MAIKNGSKPISGNVISFDDDDDDDSSGGGEHEDLFGDKQLSDSPPSRTTLPRPGMKRRPVGLLSASPGANTSNGSVSTLKRLSPDGALATQSGTTPSRSSEAPRFSSADRSTTQASIDRKRAFGVVASDDTRSASLGGVSSPPADRAASLLSKRKKTMTTGVFMPKSKRPRN